MMANKKKLEITEQDLKASQNDDYPGKTYIGERFEAARKRLGFSRQTIADYCQVSVPQIHHFESKTSGSMELFAKYLHYLKSNYHVNSGWLFADDNTEIPFQLDNINKRNVAQLVSELKQALKVDGIDQILVKQD